jgi:prepilin-type N-terminal cleavage/methylation domain-containing protein
MRRGLTLVELLVVLIILTTLVATVIPVMVPAVETRRIREAARGTSTFIAKARARAIATGRPAGLWLQRLGVEPGAATTLFVAEVPSPYAGQDNTAAVAMKKVGDVPSSDGFVRCLARLQTIAGPSPNVVPPKLIRVFDTLRVNFQGHDYLITGPDEDNDGYVDVAASSVVVLQLKVRFAGGALPWPTGPWSNPVPFQIFRQPIRSAATSFQLPEGAVIDLDGSGEDVELFDQNPLPVIITFTPEGSVDYIHHGEPSGDTLVWTRRRVTAPIHLLIGKRENVPVAANPGNENWRDLSNLWVSINPRSGRTTTSEMAASNTSSQPLESLLEARRFAREMHGMAGK